MSPPLQTWFSGCGSTKCTLISDCNFWFISRKSLSWLYTPATDSLLQSADIGISAREHDIPREGLGQVHRHLLQNEANGFAQRATLVAQLAREKKHILHDVRNGAQVDVGPVRQHDRPAPLSLLLRALFHQFFLRLLRTPGALSGGTCCPVCCLFCARFAAFLG